MLCARGGGGPHQEVDHRPQVAAVAQVGAGGQRLARGKLLPKRRRVHLRRDHRVCAVVRSSLGSLLQVWGGWCGIFLLLLLVVQAAAVLLTTVTSVSR